MHSIRVIEEAPVYELMGFDYPFFEGPTSSGNGGTTVLSCYENGGKTASI